MRCKICDTGNTTGSDVGSIYRDGTTEGPSMVKDRPGEGPVCDHCWSSIQQTIKEDKVDDAEILTWVIF